MGTQHAAPQGPDGVPAMRYVFCQKDNRGVNIHARMFPGTGPRSEAKWWAKRSSPGRSGVVLVLPDALSKTAYRDVQDKVRRYVRVFWIELPNEVGAALSDLGFSSLVALEMTSEAAMLLWSREATSSIPRQMFDDSLKAASHVWNVAWLQEAFLAEQEQSTAPELFEYVNQTTDVAAIRHKRGQGPGGVSKLAKRRENRRESGDITKTTQHNAMRRLAREKGDFLSLLHLVHIVARQDYYQLKDNPGTFAFWDIPKASDPTKYTRKELGDFLEKHLDTSVLTSVELSWGVEYLLDHYSTVFPWLEAGIDQIEFERLRRGKWRADQGLAQSAEEAVRAMTGEDKPASWNKKLLTKVIREASQDSHEEERLAAFQPPAPTPQFSPKAAPADLTRTDTFPPVRPPPPIDPPPPSHPPPVVVPSSSHGQAAAAPGSSQAHKNLQVEVQLRRSRRRPGVPMQVLCR